MNNTVRICAAAAASAAAVAALSSPGIAGAALDKAQDVIVRNSDAQPVPVKLMGRPAEPQPYQQKVVLEFQGSQYAGVNLYPDGTVTIEHVSAWDPQGRLMDLTVYEACTADGFSGAMHVPLPAREEGSRQGISHAGLLFIRPDHCIDVRATRTVAADQDVEVTLSGHRTAA